MSTPSSRTFTVIKASAGSGKTYQLVLHFLTYALRFDNAGYYIRILAITFTNAAANEMKQRVLKSLRELTDGSAKDEFVNDLLRNLPISREELIKIGRAHV